MRCSFLKRIVLRYSHKCVLMTRFLFCVILLFFSLLSPFFFAFSLALLLSLFSLFLSLLFCFRSFFFIYCFSLFPQQTLFSFVFACSFIILFALRSVRCVVRRQIAFSSVHSNIAGLLELSHSHSVAWLPR